MDPMKSAPDCDDCAPPHLRRDLAAVSATTLLLSTLPFVLTGLAASVVAQDRLYPVLTTEATGQKHGLPAFKETGKATTYSWREQLRRPTPQKLAAWVFSTSIGLSAVLVELLLCEISNTLHPAARALALRVTLSALLVLNVLVTPALEVHGIAGTLLGVQTNAVSTRRTRPKLRYALEALLLLSWLLVFWYIPRASILRSQLHSNNDFDHLHSDHAFTEACLERVGIIGVSLMASLAGFAAVSSLWQTFGVRHRTLRETDLSRKEAGLNATVEMLHAKQSRLRALQRKMSEASVNPGEPSGFVGRMMSTLPFRDAASADAQEIKALEMEISGLETMRFTLSSSLSSLRQRYTEQQRSRTRVGKLLNFSNTIFALYCAYRIVTTSLSSLRRLWQPAHSSASSDPVNNVLAVLTTHWDPSLDRAAWSRQISFLLSGIMLLASFNAVLQTFRLFARFTPSLLQAAQTSLPLIISQVAGTYVISSALLLRSNLPAEVGGVISEALGAPLEPRFVEGWFESWFLVAVALTGMGIIVGRKVGASGEWEDEFEDGGDVEMGAGKRS